MSRQDIVRNYFLRLGLDSDIADVYYTLYTQGPQTISTLARHSGIERTRIYRLLEELQASSLIEVEIDAHRKILRAAPISNLELQFAKKEQELIKLQQELPTLQRILTENIAKTSGTQIQFYHGEEGAKQLLWNETRANSEVTAILYENIQIKTAERFFERWVEKCNQRDLHFRGIVSDPFIKSQDIWYATHTNDRLKNWQARYIDSARFAINHSTIVYDDVVCYFSWQDHEIYGIEIHNAEIAETQRAFFEMLWEQAAVLAAKA